MSCGAVQSAIVAAPRPRKKGRFRVAISDRPPSPPWDPRLPETFDRHRSTNEPVARSCSGAGRASTPPTQSEYPTCVPAGVVGCVSDWTYAMHGCRGQFGCGSWTGLSLTSVYRFIGVWQQDSGKGPRLANGAACCVPDLTSHAPPRPGEHCWGGQIRLELPSPHKPVRGRIRCGWRTGGVSVSRSQIYSVYRF